MEVRLASNLRERQELRERAKLHRNNLSKTRIVTISGSVGKTSVKELSHALFTLHASTVCSPGNQNTKTALANLLLSWDNMERLAILEVGARQNGDLKQAFDFLQPNGVVLTNIGSSHSKIFGGMDNLIRNKLSVLDSSTAEYFVIPDNDPRIDEQLPSGRRVIRFGATEQAQVRIISQRAHGLCANVCLSIDGVEEEYVLPFYHEALAMNLAASRAIALAEGISAKKRCVVLKNFTAPGRFQLSKYGSSIWINDAFNASYESFYMGLKSLRRMFPDKQPIFVLGEMLELTDGSLQHQRVGKLIQNMFGDAYVFAIGPGARSYFLNGDQPGIYFESLEVARPVLECLRLDSQQKNVLIYCKGARASGIYQWLLDQEKLHSAVDVI